MGLKKCIIVSSLAFLVMGALIDGMVFAQEKETLKDRLNRQYRQTKDICPVVKNNLRDGFNTKEITRFSIELGHDVCLVMRCAIEANGNLEQIITGAIEAGTTSDVTSRCAMNAGADPKAIALYIPLPGDKLTPIDPSIPGGDPGGRIMSPATFR
jgi:hypothetical protein